MPSSRQQALESLARCLVQGARAELYLTPKPGLVDRANSGSHPDLSLAVMDASIDLLREYLEAVVASLTRGEPFACQKALGIAAEARQLERLGTNTHKGFIFLAGMLLIARWQADSADEAGWRATLSTLATDFFRAAPVVPSHGQRARDAYRAGGIVEEIRRGLPALFEFALPAWRRTRAQGADPDTAAFALLASLMQHVEDTTTLHRGGPSGLARLHQDGARLAHVIATGGDHRALLDALDRDYIRDNLTQGGVADLLGVGLAILMASGELPTPASEATV